MSKSFENGSGLGRGFVVAGLLAAVPGVTLASATAGECPADKLKADVRAPVTTPATCVTDTVPASIDRAKELEKWGLLFKKPQQ